MRSNSCPKCQASMTEGFVVDHTHGGKTVSSWVEGAPKKSWLFGVELHGKTKFEIRTLRCSRCGFLESYANG